MIKNREFELAMDEWFNQNLFAQKPIGAFICDRFDISDPALRNMHKLDEALTIIGEKYLVA